MDPILIRIYTDQVFSSFGQNKRKEVTRLLYDICRREKCEPHNVLKDDVIASHDFSQIKAFLLKRRFPSLTRDELAWIPPLDALPDILKNRVSAGPSLPSFKKVFYEKAVSSRPFVNRLRQKLPGIPFSEILSYRDHCRKNPFTISDYNRRAETLFIVEEQYDFFLHCPCSKPSQPCGYHIMNAGMGCGFDCAYCYLQGYVNAPGIVLPGNLDEILARFPSYYRSGMRLGTGQFTDSLFLDDLTGFSKEIISYFQNFPDVTFEFKTKSDCVDGVVSQPSPGNIIVSWSVNPQNLINDLEHMTASLDRRLSAAQRCVHAGYSVGFHFDPIIYYPAWEGDYRSVIKRIFETVPSESIVWISLGALRMTLQVRQVMEQRFPETWLLDADQIIGYDEKIRYPERIRRTIYQVMINAIRMFSSKVPVYLCMEDCRLNQEFGIQPFDVCSR